MLAALSTESGRHVRFAERMSLSQLSVPRTSPTVERALAAIAALDASPQCQAPQAHFHEIHDSFSALSGGEQILTNAFTDRALRQLLNRDLPEHLQRKYVWAIVATGAADTVVSLFRLVNGAEFSLSPATFRDAALALSCHKSSLGYPLTLRTIRALGRESLSQPRREAVVCGLASGAALRTALILSTAHSAGFCPRNECSPNGKFHHVAAMREMISQTTCPALRHRVIDEIASITHPFYLWNHPLMPASLNNPGMVRLPPFLMEVLRLAVTYPDPIAQRKAVQAIRCTYADGAGPEGEFVKDILAYRIGGPSARGEVESFLEHFPKVHVRAVLAEARRRACSV